VTIDGPLTEEELASLLKESIRLPYHDDPLFPVEGGTGKTVVSDNDATAFLLEIRARRPTPTTHYTDAEIDAFLEAYDPDKDIL